jgi:hypothetical protein
MSNLKSVEIQVLVQLIYNLSNVLIWILSTIEDGCRQVNDLSSEALADSGLLPSR